MVFQHLSKEAMLVRSLLGGALECGSLSTSRKGNLASFQLLQCPSLAPMESNWPLSSNLIRARNVEKNQSEIFLSLTYKL